MMEDKTSSSDSKKSKPNSESGLLASFNIGEFIQVSCNARDIKYMSRLIGVDSTSALITSLPVAKQLKVDHINYKEFYTKGDVLIMRCVVDGTVYAFKSIVIGLFTSDSKFLVSSIPEEIQKRELRSEARYPCTLISKIHVGDCYWDGVVTNISMGGCQIRVSDPKSIDRFKEISDLQILLDVQIIFPFIDDQDALEATAKSVGTAPDGNIVVGCEFKCSTSAVKRYFELSQLDLLPS